ncbi:MAG: pectate lyase-like adhesive domain-containing protein, partial [Ezakiella massiliensis]
MLTLAMLLPMVAVPVKAAPTPVSNFAELKAAIADENVSEITLTSNIILTETLVISDKTITINGTGTISADSQVSVADPAANPNVKNTLFAIKNSTVTFDGLTLDGNNQNRVIYSEGSELTFSNATITKGCPGDNSTINPGGGIFLRDGSLTATNTDFIGNTPGTNSDPTLQAGDRDLNGGAIYTGKESANITITGGKFEDNEVKAYGHGAAIYQENGSLTVTGTSFKNN